METTISCRQGTKDDLDAIRRDGETWDELLRRLAGETTVPVTNEDLRADIDRLSDRVATIERNLEAMGRHVGETP